MTLTIAPADEACQDLVTQINSASGSTYTLAVPATYSRTEVDLLEEFTGLQVDVVHMQESQLQETLDSSDNSSHDIKILVRQKIQGQINSASTVAQIAAAALIVRQIFVMIRNFISSDNRVQVWDADIDPKENPNKDLLNGQNLFRSEINLRVEVRP